MSGDKLTKRLSELRAGDHIWWEGEICKVTAIEQSTEAQSYFLVWLDDWAECECLKDDDWSVPSAEEVAEHYALRAERRRIWLESRPAAEAKCMAAARRVAIAYGKDPEVAEKQMREKLDRERAAFEEEYGE